MHRTSAALLMLLPWLLASDVTLGAPARRLPWRVELRLHSAADVRAVVQAGDLTWAATAGGLLRVDRHGKARLFTSGDGLPPGRLHALLAEPGGGLWVGGERGLARISGGPGPLEISQREQIPEVRALARFGGRLFVGTWEAGLQSLGAGEARPRQHGGRAGPRSITALAAMPEGLYVASATSGLFRWDGRRLVSLPAAGLPCRTVFALAPDGERLWVGTLAGLGLLERGQAASSPETRLAARLPVRDLRAVLATERGLVLGTFGGGAHRVIAGAQGHEAALERISIPGQSRVAALARGQGGLLVGTAAGLHLEGRDGYRSVLLPGPPSNDISALAQGRSGLWVGTFDAGLALYQQGRWQYFDLGSGLVDDWINHLAVQEAGGREHLWVATPKGASRYDGARWQSFLPGRELAPGHVNSVQVSPRGDRVLLASSRGITIHQGGHWQRLGRDQGLPLRNVTAAAFAAEDELWVAGADGLARYRGGRWVRFQAASRELPDDWVTALLPTSQGLWVGTYSHGLALGKDRGWQHLGEPEGMPCGWVNLQALAWIEQKLWVGSLEGGLLVLSSRYPSTWERLTVSDGLPSPDVTAIAAAPEGRVWVGTRAGVVLLGRSGRR